MIPTTVYNVSLRSMDFPTASGDEANFRLHKFSLISATGAPPSRSSDSVKVRPSTGFTPSSGKNEAETISPSSRSGSPLPVKLKSSERYAAKSENERFSRRQSRKFGYGMEDSVNWVVRWYSATSCSGCG